MEAFGSAFQVVPPVVRTDGNELEIDADFALSLKVYLRYFKCFTVACPVLTEGHIGSGLGNCIPFGDLDLQEGQFKFIPLPMTFNPIRFKYQSITYSKILRQQVREADYIIVTPYSPVADWPSIAIREAQYINKPYVIEADGVHSDINRKRFLSRRLLNRFIQLQVLYPYFDYKYKRYLENSKIGIFQGRDVYNAYHSYCPEPHELNHHIPIYSGDHITEKQTERKVSDIKDGAPLKIVYSGRAVDMKGPLLWIETLLEIRRLGIEFEASWVGDGPMLTDMRKKIEEHELQNVSLPGFCHDRSELYTTIKQSHIFMFCHTTLESARILGESLACGTPIVGFESDYPAGLTEELGGGLFTAHDPISLANSLVELDSDRDTLATLVRDAAITGARFDREEALIKRALLVKGMK